MRRILAVAALALSTFGVAMAAQDEATAGRAYLSFSFGGQKLAARDLHYGLRFDYDSRYAAELGQVPTAPLMQFDFTRAGLAAARVNGLNILKPSYTLKQNDQSEVPAETEAPAEEAPAEEAPAEAASGDAAPAEGAPAEAAAVEQPGFLSRTWTGVKNLFTFGGGAEEAATETASAPAADTPAETPAEDPADVAQGIFMGYNAIDWGTLAIGVVGLGAIVSEVSNGKESGTVSSSGSGGGGSGGGCPAGQRPNPLPPPAPPCLPAFAGAQNGGAAEERRDPEHQQWLDEGSGHMGDLIAR